MAVAKRFVEEAVEEKKFVVVAEVVVERVIWTPVSMESIVVEVAVSHPTVGEEEAERAPVPFP